MGKRQGSKRIPYFFIFFFFSNRKIPEPNIGRFLVPETSPLAKSIHRN